MTHEFSKLTLLGIATLLGFYFGKGSKIVKLPSIIGYMLLGVILGTSVLHLFNEHNLKDLQFLNNFVLGVVAFSIGAELNLRALRKLGSGIVTIIFSESLIAFAAVTGIVYLVTKDLPMALVFGAMAPASAPAGTVAVIQETRSRGNLTKALYAVVGFDDGLAIIIFGFAFALAKKLLVAEATGNSSVSLWYSMGEPLKEILLSSSIGLVIGVLFFFMARSIRNPNELIVIIFGAILIATGISVNHHLSLILTNMMVGLFFANATNPRIVHKVMRPVREIMPLLFIWFFCLAGAHLEVAKLPQLGLIGLIYIAARSGGLIFGAFLGGCLGHVDKKIKKWIGLGILSQAGVAIGLSLIVKNDFATMGLEHADKIGAAVITTITATCIFFEVVGPICTKFALEKAGEIPTTK